MLLKQSLLCFTIVTLPLLKLLWALFWLTSCLFLQLAIPRHFFLRQLSVRFHSFKNFFIAWPAPLVEAVAVRARIGSVPCVGTGARTGASRSLRVPQARQDHLFGKSSLLIGWSRQKSVHSVHYCTAFTLITVGLQSALTLTAALIWHWHWWKHHRTAMQHGGFHTTVSCRFLSPASKTNAHSKLS